MNSDGKTNDDIFLFESKKGPSDELWIMNYELWIMNYEVGQVQFNANKSGN